MRLPFTGQTNQILKTTPNVRRISASLCAALTLLSMTDVTHAAAEEISSERIRIIVPRIDDPQINIDGTLDEAVWQQLPSHDGMFVIEPDTLVPARYQSNGEQNDLPQVYSRQ